jgi:Carboxypeptidase regulatory-like domain/TonB dependent receptor
MRLLKTTFLAFIITLGAFAQTDRGTITGTVSDPAGAVVANAVVEAKNTESGTTFQAGTSATGNYTLAQMPVGTYEVSATSSGFKKAVRPGVIVSVAVTVRVDFALEVGTSTESVTVQAEAPLLKTESGELSHTVETSRVDNLPLLDLNGAGGGLGNIRNPLSIITLLPGSSFQTDNTLRINGMPSSSAAVRIEGQDATNGTWKQLTQATQSGVDSIQEVNVQTSNFAAEYGQVGGGYINMTMRSGTNQIHGSAYDYFDNEALNAGIPFTNDGAGHLQRNSVRRNDFGFTFGGPVVVPHYNGRDKTFFFVNFEQFRENRFIVSDVATVPTAAYRNGDFSGAIFPVPFLKTPPDPMGRSFFPFTVFDPNSTFTGPGGALLRNPYPNGMIPKSDFDPIALKLQALTPLPNIPGALVNNYAVPGYSNFQHTTIPSIKIDQSLSPTMKIAGYMSVTRTESPGANGFPTATLNTIPTDDTTYTTRINFDDTLKPTLLLHLGIGLLYYQHPQYTQHFDQSNYWPANAQFAANTYAPSIGAAENFFTGGVSMGSGLFGGTGPGAPGFANVDLRDVKPTANASMTWVKGNHTFKFGGELVIEGFPQPSSARANGGFNFGNAETANPWDNGNVNPLFQTGFPYASFLIGAANSLQYSAITDSRLGNHAIGLFAQDTWKVTRRFTLDYGLRYDYQTLLTEQYGRMQDAAFNTPNPVVGGRLGSVVYGGSCNCSLNHNYPYAIGPRLGAAYQITPKTVFRAGFGVAYSASANNAFLSYSVPDFYTLNEPAWGIAAAQLSAGNPYAPGNPYGNPVPVYPNFTPQFPQKTASGSITPASPFISIDRNAGRPARTVQWSIGIQREVMRNLVVEAEYVGNRGAWWTAPVLAGQNYNALTPQGLLQNSGIDVSKAADRALLTTPISSPAVIARFPYLANPNNVYPGFPANEPLNQALRPYPQWLGIPPFLGPPLGDTWYDSLQAKLTKRYSHGLDVQAAFTWQKELTNGVTSDTSYFTPGTVLINDVFNHAQNKQISDLSHPLLLVISFNYTTPKFKADGTGMKALSWAARDWVFGGVLRYQSGNLIPTPPSSNNFFTQLARTDNPATFGGANTFENRNTGAPLLSVDPNCHCFDPQRTLPLNANAWTDAAPGTFGTAAAYYNNYRWQRWPAESLSLGRQFPLAKEGRVVLHFRAEFYNIFNRVQLTPPSVGGAFAPVNSLTAPATDPNGAYTAGYGFINMVPGGFNFGYVEKPRSGQLVARITF